MLYGQISYMLQSPQHKKYLVRDILSPNFLQARIERTWAKPEENAMKIIHVGSIEKKTENEVDDEGGRLARQGHKKIKNSHNPFVL